jgi:ubiquitin carboxyl-terminal hydrolase 10
VSWYFFGHTCIANIIRILFSKEFHIIGSADSADLLRRRLNDTKLEQYGDQLTPEYVYDAIKQNPGFSNMRVS